jgi:hypothetical protein
MFADPKRIFTTDAIQMGEIGKIKLAESPITDASILRQKYDLAAASRWTSGEHSCEIARLNSIGVQGRGF